MSAADRETVSEAATQPISIRAKRRKNQLRFQSPSGLRSCYQPQIGESVRLNRIIG